MTRDGLVAGDFHPSGPHQAEETTAEAMTHLRPLGAMVPMSDRAISESNEAFQP